MVHCSPSHLEEVESILKESGSEEIKINGVPVVTEQIVDTKEEEVTAESTDNEVAAIEEEKNED